MSIVLITCSNERVNIKESKIEKTKALYGFSGTILPRNICYYYTAGLTCPKGSDCTYYHISRTALCTICPETYYNITREPKYIILTKNDEEVIRLQPETIEETEYEPILTTTRTTLPVLTAPISRVCRHFLDGNCHDGKNCSMLHIELLETAKVDKAIIMDNLPEFAIVPVNRNRRVINRQIEVNKLYFSYGNGHVSVHIIPPPPPKNSY